MVLAFDRWVGKTAVVTGASSGIGAEIADRLVKEGLQVVGIARRVEKIEKRAKSLAEGGRNGKLYAVKADVTKETDILNAFRWIAENVGPVHILVNNAGIILENTLVGGTTLKWKKVFDTNVMGLCIATREAINSMQNNKIDGHIIHINSEAGHKIVDFPGMSVYPASKHAVSALADYLRYELTSQGSKIKVTSISPGIVSTEIFGNCNSEVQKALKNQPKLHPDDIAETVVYVLSMPPHVQIKELVIKPVGEKF